MLCEKILGKITDTQFAGKPVDYVEIEWHETYKKLHRKTSRAGRDIAISLDDSILHRGIKPGDVLGVDVDGTVIAVDIPETQVLCATVINPTAISLAKIGYEIGNCHAPLFAGKNDNEFITIYDRPMEVLLKKLNGIKVEVRTEKLDFTKQISTIVGHGHHEHDVQHDHEDNGHHHDGC
jgi:urease accessory protein